MGVTLHLGIVAGELSGDRLGAGLMRALQEMGVQRGVSLRFFGVGGPLMLSEGLEPLADMGELSVNGFSEPLKRLPSLLSLLKRLRQEVLSRQAHGLIGVDFNVFNLLLERSLKKRGVPTVHYVSPSVYAWRRGRAKRIGRSADLLLTLYPFEPAYYAQTPVRAVFVGHPMAYEITTEHGSDAARRAARAELGLRLDEEVIALLPGSRSSEVELMGPVFAAAAAQLQRRRARSFLVPCVTPAIEDKVKAQLKAAAVTALCVRGDARRVLTACDAALVKSGTGTLEAMLLRRPMVVGYRLGELSYQIIHRLVNTPFIALPNILACEAWVPELLQHDGTPQALAETLDDTLDRVAADPGYLDRFAALAESLRAGADANATAASAVFELLIERHAEVLPS